MQTLERAIIEPEGWYFIETKLTSAGRKKVADLYDYVYLGGWATDQLGKTASFYDANDTFEEMYFDSSRPSLENLISDIESESTDGLMHPVCKMQNYFAQLVEGVDYVLQFQSKQAFELAMLAQRLNDLHDTMQSEMQRLGW